MGSWVFHTSNQPFIIGSYAEIKFSKIKQSVAKVHSLCQGFSVLLFLFLLKLSFHRADLFENVAFSIVTLSGKSDTPVF